jgi:hypothetical protein
MKCAWTVLLAATLCFAAPALAGPEPLVAEETAIEAEPSPALSMPIRVGGPCGYETTEIVATLVDLSGDSALLLPPEGRSFSLNAAAFPPKGTAAEAGKPYRISKRTNTKGTCQPIIYDLIGPVTDEPARAD